MAVHAAAEGAQVLVWLQTWVACSGTSACGAWLC